VVVGAAGQSGSLGRHSYTSAMPSSIAHGLTAVAVGTVFFPAERTRRLYVAAACGAVLLDIDAIGRPFGLGDLAILGGHRALTHSLLFAALVSLAIVTAMYRGADGEGRRLRIFACFALALALHGVLDAFTTYGEGVMFFAPFSTARYRSPCQPLRGLLPEVVGVWLPMLALIVYKRRQARSVSSRLRTNEEL
jgi:inner membrane protein